MNIVRGYRNMAGGAARPIEGLGRYGDAPAAPLPVPPEYSGNPVFLSANAQLDPRGNGSPNNEALRNPYPYPIEIHKIRFTAYGLQNKTAEGYGSPGPQMAVSLALPSDQGELPVTKDYVPIYAICPGAGLNSESRAFIVPSTKWPAFFACNYEVSLNPPLLLRAGEILAAKFNNRGYVAGGDQINQDLPGSTTMYIAYLGRTREDLKDRLPESRTVPYFVAWSPAALSQPASGVPASESSTENDLVNKDSRPVTLVRFIGRLAAQNAATSYGSATSTLTELTDSNLSFDPRAFPAQEAIRIGMFRSNGIPIIAPGTPVRLAFDSLTRAWEIEEAGLVLDPNEYLRAQIQVAAPDTGIQVSAAQVFAVVGLTGYREVPL